MREEHAKNFKQTVAYDKKKTNERIANHYTTISWDNPFRRKTPYSKACLIYYSTNKWLQYIT
jgi:hypothetical protein